MSEVPGEATVTPVTLQDWRGWKYVRAVVEVDGVRHLIKLDASNETPERALSYLTNDLACEGKICIYRCGRLAGGRLVSLNTEDDADCLACLGAEDVW